MNEVGGLLTITGSGYKLEGLMSVKSMNKKSRSYRVKCGLICRLGWNSNPKSQLSHEMLCLGTQIVRKVASEGNKNQVLSSYSLPFWENGRQESQLKGKKRKQTLWKDKRLLLLWLPGGDCVSNCCQVNRFSYKRSISSFLFSQSVSSRGSAHILGRDAGMT